MHVLLYFYLLKSKVLKCYLVFNAFSDFFQMYKCNAITYEYVPFFPPHNRIYWEPGCNLLLIIVP